MGTIPEVTFHGNTGEYATKTFLVDQGFGQITGYADELQAVKQTVDIILHTERYDYQIYSTDFGREFHSLIGKPPEYVMSMLKRRIEESLLPDGRITGVDQFIFDQSVNTVKCTFVVHTVFGDTEAEVVLN